MPDRVHAARPLSVVVDCSVFACPRGTGVFTWQGLLVSDGYGLYRKWEHGRQTCLAHLARRAKAVSEHFNPEIAKCGSWILKEIRLLCDQMAA
jgi:hypothetical protein